MSKQGLTVEIPAVNLPAGCYIPDEVFQAIEVLKDPDAFFIYFMVFVRLNFSIPRPKSIPSKTGEQICIETKLSESVVARSLDLLLEQNLIYFCEKSDGFYMSLKVNVPHSRATDTDKEIGRLKVQAVSLFAQECKTKVDRKLQMMHLNNNIAEIKDKRNTPRYLNDLMRAIRWEFAQGHQHTSMRYFTPERVAGIMRQIGRSKPEPEARGAIFTPNMDAEIKTVTMAFYRSHQREPLNNPEDEMKDRAVEKLMKFFARHNMAVTQIEVAKKVDSEWNQLKIN